MFSFYQHQGIIKSLLSVASKHTQIVQKAGSASFVTKPLEPVD